MTESTDGQSSTTLTEEEQRALAVADILERVRAAPAAKRSGTAITDDDVALAALLPPAEYADLEAGLKAAGVTLANFRARVKRARRGHAAASRLVDGEDNWDKRLIVGEHGGVLSCPANAITILRNHPDWRGVLAWDDFSQVIIFRREPQWCPDDAPGDTPTDEDPNHLDDAGVTRISAWLMRCFQLHLEDRLTYKALLTVAKATVVNPVREGFDALVWDGIDRLDTWLSVYLGVAPSDYSTFVGRSYLIQAVARVYEPGCQADATLILEGDQDAGKSSALRILFRGYFSETELDLNSKDRFVNLRGLMCQSFDELASLSRSEHNAVKNYLTSTFDTFRQPYGAHPIRVKRRLVFAGTINPPNGAGYLKDTTGNRRFWPVMTAAVGPIDLEALRRDCPQLWAEAVHRYKAGTKWHAVTAKEKSMCRAEQETRQEAGAWDELIGKWLSKIAQPSDCFACFGKGWKPSSRQINCEHCNGTGKVISPNGRPSGDYVTQDDVLRGALGLSSERWPTAYKGVGEALARCGWLKGPRVVRDGVKVTPYYPPGKRP
jgi:putative DNA primase/helicase